VIRRPDVVVKTPACGRQRKGVMSDGSSGDDRFSTKRLLALRKLTRSVADLLRERATQYVTTLTPLLRPRVALGDPGDAGTKEPLQVADKTFKELQALYEQVAASAPFNLRRDLKPPLDVVSWNVELWPVEYSHAAQGDGGSGKTVRIVSPLKWVIGFSGITRGDMTRTNFSPRRLRELLADRSRDAEELRQLVLHYLVMSLALSRAPGLSKLMADLHFTLGSEKFPDFGPLPVPCIRSVIQTLRPPDDVLIEHTEIAGTDTFEEVVNTDDIAALRDPVRDRLLELTKVAGIELVLS
jgi:hypothetical protein